MSIFNDVPPTAVENFKLVA